MFNGAGRPTGQDARLYDTIRRWRDDLVNLTARNRLLNFRATRTSTVRVLAPAPAELLAGLVADREYRFQPQADDLETHDRTVKVGSDRAVLDVQCGRASRCWSWRDRRTDIWKST